ncbi:exodeoxyribonuclease V subunit beta [Halomonas sp. BLK-85]
MTQPTPLNPLTLPLHGSRLIEASAGTGKTFTIALLYVRLVLGGRHSEDATAFMRPLTPPEILVMTFTNAATQELRERIRKRLVEAAGTFRNSLEPASADSLLLELRDQYDPAAWPACARRLELAAEWMDEAAVSTIHSWCYRMLREHAFDSGSLFSLNLENDQHELQQEVVRDYWRTFYYPLDADALGSITRYWSSPDALYDDVRKLLHESDALGSQRPVPTATLSAAEAERSQRLEELKAPWRTWVNELRQLFDDGQKAKLFAAGKMRKDHRGKWLDKIQQWAESDLIRPDLDKKVTAWKRLTPAGIAEIWNESPPSHPAFEAFEALPAALETLPEPRSDLLIHAVQWCKVRLEREQERRAEMGPNDLLTHLDRALQGPNKEALAAQILRQFPVALIDEFQDTDPIQYRIFNAVYQVAHPRRNAAMLLIGDPKQAIYAFRGADIFTYLQARQDTDGRHVTLGTNFRSTHAMVEAVNHCFHFADQHPAGAFLFRAQSGDNPLPFLPVGAKGRKEQLSHNGQPLPAMSLWCLESDEPLSKSAYQPEMAERCASYMVELLSAGQQAKSGFLEDDTLIPLKPSDMAVLVNGQQEARAIRQALASRGVKSVYLSDHDKVFSSPIASQMERWLLACAEPLASSRQAQAHLRAALASPALGLDFAALDHLQHDELAWEARVEQFSHYHRLWQRQGVLPLVRRIMVDFDVPARLLAEFQEGERLLTDLLHLGELLQQASAELDGEHALIRFLAEAIADPESHGDSHKLRLESDADLVQVITIHKSKGLQYPLVFLPFIANHRPVKQDDLPLRWHDHQGQLQLSLNADDTLLEHADRERLGEDLRKLYVALTRAQHATWLGVAALKELKDSALGYLLNGGQPTDPAALRQALAALADGSDIRVSEPPLPSLQRLDPPPHSTALGHARTPARPAKEHWWIASYSALRLSGTLNAPTATQEEPGTAQEATALEVLDEPQELSQERSQALSQPDTYHLHRFPRGPGPGTFLHGLLEWAGKQGFASVAKDVESLNDMLWRRVQLRGWQAWQEPLAGWFSALLTTPLPLANAERTRVTLAELKSCQVELEFWLAAKAVNTRQLDALVSQHLLPGMARPALDADTLNGMLKGFIDLAFEHQGRFYVLDWKSNYLGPNDAAYAPDALCHALLEKRYDVQSALYLLAMHRLLKSRLPNYDPRQHLGGAMTVFLRGSRHPERGVYGAPAPVELIEALDRLFSHEPSAHTPEEASA